MTPQRTAERLDDNDLQILDVIAERYGSGEEFAGAWIRAECENRGVPFHQAKLGRLGRLGLLIRGDTARGGTRRYYRLASRVFVSSVLDPSRTPVV